MTAKKKLVKASENVAVELENGQHHRVFLVTEDPRGRCVLWPLAAKASLRFEQRRLEWTTDGKFFGMPIEPAVRRALIGSRDGYMERVVVVD